MIKILKSLTFCGLFGAMFCAHGENAGAYRDLLVQQIGHTCLTKAFDQRRFDLAKSQVPTISDEEAVNAAATPVKFNQKIYDSWKVQLPPASDEFAVDLATTYKYADNSSLCRQLRKEVAALAAQVK